MFAVLRTGGKQYRVSPGDVLRVEKLAADAGDTVQFNEVLVLGGDSPVVGAPLVDDAAVQATVIDQIKGEKVIHFVKRRRKHSSQRTKGHRQQLTLLRVTDILASGAAASGVKAAVGAGSVPRGTAAPAAPVAADAAAGGAQDDLKRLTGVGPKMEAALKAAGVSGFAQIAAWNEEEIAHMEGQLSARGKVAGWVAEAATLAATKE